MTDEELEAALYQLVKGGEMDRILRSLRSQWERVPRETIADVVGEAAMEVVRRHRDGQEVTNVLGLITTIARRTLSKVWAAMQDAQDAQSALKLQTLYPDVWQHDEERIAKVKRAATYVRTLVVKLDNENHRRTMFAMLDAAQEGRQLQNRDLAEQLGCSPDTAGKWKERAPRRLLPILREAGFGTLDDLLAYPAAFADDDPYDEHDDADDRYEEQI